MDSRLNPPRGDLPSFLPSRSFKSLNERLGARNLASSGNEKPRTLLSENANYSRSRYPRIKFLIRADPIVAWIISSIVFFFSSNYTNSL